MSLHKLVVIRRWLDRFKNLPRVDLPIFRRYVSF